MPVTMKRPPPIADDHDDDAPDLSTPEWRGKFSKALLTSAPLEGVELDRQRDMGRDVQFIEDSAPLHTEEEYEKALREIEQYFRQEPEPNSPEARRFTELTERIGFYEDKHRPIAPPVSDE
jgi:hypothetical protein